MMVSHPPIKVFYYHYHNSIRAELADLSAAVTALEDAPSSNAAESLVSLKRRVAFLYQVYSIHSSVEDEVNYSNTCKHIFVTQDVKGKILADLSIYSLRICRELVCSAGGISCSGPEGQERHPCILSRA